MNAGERSYEMLEQRGEQGAAGEGNLDHHVVRSVWTRLQKNAVHGEQDEVHVVHIPNRVGRNKTSGILRFSAK